MSSPQLDRRGSFGTLDNMPLRRSKSLASGISEKSGDVGGGSEVTTTVEIPMLQNSRSLNNLRSASSPAAASPPTTPLSGSASPTQLRPESPSIIEHLPAITPRSLPRRLDPINFSMFKSKKELEAERLEQERLERERREQERLARLQEEQERERQELERQERERAEKERAEKERQHREQQRLERERVAREREERAAREREEQAAKIRKEEEERLEREKEKRLARLKQEEEERRERELAEQSKTKCHHCSKPIVGQFIMAMEKTWHPDHFVCFECNQPFADGVFFEKDGHPYCRTHYESLFARKCNRCKQPISGQVTTANGQEYHPACFVCVHCNQPFPGGVFFQKDGQNYDATCYGTLFAPKCSGCDKPITGSVLTAGNKSYHPGCFACAQCKKPLGGGSPFYERNGKPYCDKC